MRYFLSFVAILLLPCNVASPEKEKADWDKYIETYRAQQWEWMVRAICQTESGMDDNARNPHSSAAGRFQMLRMYVDDVNRICGEKRYTYDDRHDAAKAREMFEIVQGHYNPEHDIDKAIILHRGKKSKKYIQEIKNKMETYAKGRVEI